MFFMYEMLSNTANALVDYLQQITPCRVSSPQLLAIQFHPSYRSWNKGCRLRSSLQLYAKIAVIPSPRFDPTERNASAKYYRNGRPERCLLPNQDATGLVKASRASWAVENANHTLSICNNAKSIT
jgi:hypothetical protein